MQEVFKQETKGTKNHSAFYYHHTLATLKNCGLPPPLNPHLTSLSCCIFPSAQTQRLRQALQDSQADRDTARLDKELLAQRLKELEQEAQNKKRSQDDRTRQFKGLEVGTLCGGLVVVGAGWKEGGLGPGTGGRSVVSLFSQLGNRAAPLRSRF